MAEAKKDIKKLKTPRFRGSYVTLFEPRGMEGGAEKFSVLALFAKSADLTEMKKLAFKAGEERFGKKWNAPKGQWPKGFRSPFRDASERQDQAGFEDGMIFCTLSANVDYPPLVVGKDAVKIDPMDRDARKDFYSGAYYTALINAYAYDASGNKGVAFGLLGIQKVAEGERLGGGVGARESDFDAVEDESDDASNYGESDDDAPMTSAGF